MFCRKNLYLSSAVDVRIISQQEDEHISGKTTSFLAEFADTWQRLSGKEDRRTASELVDLLTDRSFEEYILTKYIKVLPTTKKPSREGREL